MKCPECVKAGQTSRVTVGMSTSTLMSGSSFYDENGDYHSHDPNTTETDYACSNGHQWQESTRSKCWCQESRPGSRR